MQNDHYELWIEGEHFKVLNYHLGIKKKINSLGVPEGPATSTLKVTIPFSKIEPEDIKDWMIAGKLVKNTDLLFYENKELVQHFRIFEGRCIEYFEYYDNDRQGMYIELCISTTRAKMEPII